MQKFLDKNIVAEIKVLEKYYDSVRLVDPSTVITTASNIVTVQPKIICVASKDCQQDWSCQHFGRKGQSCSPCICQQAINFQESFSKIEILNGKLFLLLAMPLQLQEGLVAIGMVKEVNAKTLNHFLSIPDKIADVYCSVAQLNDLAFRDALTNVYNRRYIDKQLLLELKQLRQGRRSFSILMADIDFFKQINDQYGHSVGDEVLSAFAGILTSQLRPEKDDWVARYGGEEFLLVLTDCCEGLARRIAEDVRRKIEEHIFLTAAGELHVTSSFGVYTPTGEEEEVTKLIDRVDSYLYQAKQAGRNCILFNQKLKIQVQ